MAKRISVCIPTYNGAKYIKKQLETILSQLSVEDEVVISDDSSTDETLSIIKSINDNRIRILAQNEFHSPIFNLENALKAASGDYIFLADQDDVWLDNKVEELLKLLEENYLAISDCSVIDASGEIIEPSFFRKMQSGPGFWKNWKRNSYIGCCMAFRKEVLSFVLPFPRNIPMHDMWISLMVESKRLPIRFYAKPLMLYRRHGNNASTSSEPSNRTLWQKIHGRLILLWNVTKRNCIG